MDYSAQINQEVINAMPLKQKQVAIQYFDMLSDDSKNHISQEQALVVCSNIFTRVAKNKDSLMNVCLFVGIGGALFGASVHPAAIFVMPVAAVVIYAIAKKAMVENMTKDILESFAEIVAEDKERTQSQPESKDLNPSIFDVPPQ